MQRAAQDPASPSANSPPTPPPRLRSKPGSTGRVLLAVALAVIVVLAGYGGYAYLQAHPSGGEPVLWIATYESLFSGNCGAANLTALLDEFGQAHSVQVKLICPSQTLSSWLDTYKNDPQADVVLGLDEITAPQADADGVLVDYTPPALSDEVPGLANALSPDHAVVPYEYGLLGVDYTAQFRNATHDAADNFSFEQLASNSSWSSAMTIEDPTTDITGEEFLMWEIQYYTQILHQDWQPFWASIDPHVHYVTLWSTAYSEFGNDTIPSPPQLIPSYTLDVTAGPPGTIYSQVAHHNGSRYGWQTIYGLGIVKGTTHLSLDQQFINWWLGPSVQSQLPTYEYEYPANASTPLPSDFSEAVPPSSVVALNTPLTTSTVSTWLDDWQAIENSHPSP
jgi:ABC-type thiamine transport system substrate-binding protein